MSNVSSLTSSSSYSSSSIYGSRNVLSGLASGLDTETLIENSILGYQTKIQSLIQQQTKLTWKQEAYRNITDQLISLSSKYTSYTSNTNLSSNSFFNKAVNTVTNGTYADKVAATGKSSSDIQIKSVEQLATAATYKADVSELYNLSNLKGDGITGSAVSFDASTAVSDISGSIIFKAGNDSFEISFASDDIVETTDGKTQAEALADMINSKLAEQKASDYVKATADGDSIKIEAGSIAASEGSSVYISSAYGDIKDTLGITTGKVGDTSAGRSISVGSKTLSHEGNTGEALSGQTVSVTLDGTTKTITLGEYKDNNGNYLSGEDLASAVKADLTKGLKSAFGTKVSFDLSKDDNGRYTLSFDTTSDGSTLKVTSTANDALGLGSNGISNYLDTSSTLGELLGANLDGLTAVTVDAANVTVDSNGSAHDQDGNTVVQEDGVWYQVDNDGNKLYDLVINDVSVGQFTTDTAFESVLTAINGNSEAGVTVSYSQMTNKFTFTASETGSQGQIEFGNGLATALFGKNEVNYAEDTITDENGKEYSLLTDNSGNAIVAGTYTDENGEEVAYGLVKSGDSYYRVRADDPTTFVDREFKGYDDDFNPVYESSAFTGDDAEKIIADVKEKARKNYTAGQDAVVNVSVNGDDMKLVRSTNVVSMDGLSVTLKGTFNADVEDPTALTGDDVVTFTTSADADKIVDAIKSFVDELNQVLKDTHDAFSTTPLKNSSDENYEPLTEDDKADMTESEIENYEEKAKTGILFGDSDLTTLYDKLRNVIVATGNDRKAMEAIGLTTTYEDGVTTLSLDEDKLREALAADPDSVRNVFTKTTESGSSTDGLMAKASKVFTSYASTTYGSYGILVNKAGTKTKSLSLTSNALQKQIDSLDTQIDKWQDRMSDKIDYYNRQFTLLEQLMQTYNDQSSALSGMLGY